MSGAEWLPGSDRIWRLTDERWNVLATLQMDPETFQYKDGSGRLMGRKWEEARARVEDAVRKGEEKRCRSL